MSRSSLLLHHQRSRAQIAARHPPIRTSRVITQVYFHWRAVLKATATGLAIIERTQLIAKTLFIDSRRRTMAQILYRKVR
jgi:hypothetical protein